MILILAFVNAWGATTNDLFLYTVWSFSVAHRILILKISSRGRNSVFFCLMLVKRVIALSGQATVI